jgi:prepilin-type N-terminal cleavage/methylation domain-containing protein
MKKAFTLIELLVVIAIIAILAAILFPVFAQAKAAAKATASISNTKQISLAIIQYGADVDDTFVPGQIRNTDASSGYAIGTGTLSTPWTKLVHPYMKNTDVYRDPLGPNMTSFTGMTAQDAAWLTPHYGLNAYNLNDLYNDIGMVGKSMTAAANPADTVLLCSKNAYGEIVPTPTFSGVSLGAWGGSYYSWISMAPLGVVPARNWGKGGSFDTQISTVAAGRFTGGNSLRATNSAIVAFTDGHVGKRSPGALAIGTPFRYDATGANQSNASDITSASVDVTKYLWDLQ